MNMVSGPDGRQVCSQTGEEFPGFSRGRFRFIKNIAYLVLLKINAFKNGISVLRIKDLPRIILFSVIAISFVLLDYVFFYKVIRYIFNLNEGIGNLIIVELFRVVFVSFFTMVIFSSVILSASNFYMSSDLPYLLSMPVSTVNILCLKLFQSIIQAVWMPFLFGIPVFIAMGRVYGLESYFYFISILYFIFLLIIAGGIGCTISQLMVKLFRPDKVYQAVCIAGAIMIVLMLLLLRAVEPERLIGDVPDELVQAFLEQIKIPDYFFLPTSWGAIIVGELMDGKTSKAFSLLFLSFGAGVFSVMLSLCFAFYYYESSLYRSLDGSKFTKKNRSVLSAKKIYKGSCFKEIIAIWEKDIKTFKRDPSQWTQTLLLGALMVIYLFNIYKLPLNNYYLKNFVAFINLAMAGFVLSALCARFVYPSVSMEGRSIWIVRSMPLASSKYIFSKYFLHLVPLLLFAEILTYVSNLMLDVSAFIMTLSLITIAVITATMVALAVGFGALYPVYVFESIVQVSASYGGIILMILSLGYVGIIITLEAFPVYAYFQRELFLRDVGGAGVYLGYGCALILSIVTASISLFKGIKAFSESEI